MPTIQPLQMGGNWLLLVSTQGYGGGQQYQQHLYLCLNKPEPNAVLSL